MQINQYCKLVMRDVYSYDIEACHFNILKNMGYDVSHIDYENKEKRNIQIGKMMKEDYRLLKLLRNTTESIINEYINRSNIKNEDIITRQYDGLICTKPLEELDLKVPLKLKRILDFLIISINRDSFVGSSGNKKIIKGIPSRYDNMDKILYKLLDINFLSKNSIFVSLQEIKDLIFKSSDNNIFFIPSKVDDSGAIIFKRYGQVKINKSMVNIIDSDDIDRDFYFNFYIRPFTESITIEFI